MTNFVTAKYDSATNRISDPTANSQALMPSLDSKGNPNGIANPADSSQQLLPQGRRTRIISALGGWTTNATAQITATLAANQSRTDRIYLNPFADATDLQLLYVNGFSSTNGKVNSNGNAVQISASIENGSAPYPQFSFKGTTGVKANSDAGGGRTAHFAGDGEVVLTDPLSFIALTSVNNYIHQYTKVNLGEKYSITGIPISGVGNQTTATDGGGVLLGDGTDQTASFVGMVNHTGSTFGVFPHAVLGKMLKPVAVTLIAGDSIADGTAGGTGAYLGLSYPHVALNDAGLKWSKAAVSGCTMSNLYNNNTYIGLLGQYVDTVAWVMGTNDLAVGATLAQMQAYLYNNLAKFSGNPRINIFTLPPRPASTTDSWATTRNQTLASWEPVRVAYNNWLRTSAIADLQAKGINVVAISDICLGLEYNLNNTPMTLVNGYQISSGANSGGYWKPSTTADGIHPNNSGIDAAKPNVDVSTNKTGFGFIVY